MSESVDTALQLAALAWRERWTGELVVHVGSGRKVLPFKQGGPVNPADFTLLNAYASKEAEFLFGEQKRRGLRGGLGPLLLRVGSRGQPLSSGRIQMMLATEDAQDLELPEPLIELTARAGARPEVEHLQRDLEDPQLLGVLVNLGFAKHLAQAQPSPFVDPSVGNLLSGLSELTEFFQGVELGAELEAADPEEQLIDRMRALCAQGSWSQAEHEMAEYIGAVDSAELAAWRAWVRLNSPQHPEDERLSDALRWTRIAERLPSSAESDEVLAWVKQRCEQLIEQKQQEWRCA